MFDRLDSTYPAIQQWEEAGVSLFNAPENYLKQCTCLGNESLVDGVPPTYLAARINAALGSLHTTLAQQLARSQSALCQTRNQMLVPLHSFPEEVLSEIFMHVAFDPLNQFRRHDSRSMRVCVIDVHRAIHNLLGVCTMWRNVAVNRGTLWSIVPLFDKFNIPQDYKLILNRALHLNNGVELNLFADMRDDKTDLSILAGHVTQFRTVTSVNTPPHIIRNILAAFTDWHGPEPLKLSQLSLYNEHHYSSLPRDETCIFQTSSEQQSFNRLVQNLDLLQMKGISFQWETVAFSGRLTTFCLQDVTLGFDIKLAALLRALSSATQLRELKIIDVITFRDSAPLQTLVGCSKIWLPTLETFYIEGLYFNTLRLLLLSIRSRSHRLSLTLTHNFNELCCFIPPRLETVTSDEIGELLRLVSVHELDIRKKSYLEPALTAVELKKLVEALPLLETLHLHMTLLGGEHCMALERRLGPHRSTLPSLVHLRFSCVRIEDPQAFRHMVESHSGSLQRVSLAKPYPHRVHAVDEELELHAREEVIDWLAENVPEYTRTTDWDDYFNFQNVFQEKW
ncbi:unnamed protein product [Rhizoctonia solani]|uniref:F-box domain-containing protein n=1 Tax=Rhizoctonia solani TaxID=456999 RepID=A0A8H3A263_9AGAM|nr:unnamed protein product [Rhizoctonia solani]